MPATNRNHQEHWKTRITRDARHAATVLYGQNTPFKTCIAPSQHKVTTYYRHFLQADVCDLCHEGTAWVIVNLWRYPDKSHKAIRVLLHIPEPTLRIASSEETLECLEIVGSSDCTANTEKGASDIVERCTCGNVAKFVGMEGESLCEVCYGIMLSSMVDA